MSDMTNLRRISLSWNQINATATFICMCGSRVNLDLHHGDMVVCGCKREYIINPPEVKMRRPKE